VNIVVPVKKEMGQYEVVPNPRSKDRTVNITVTSNVNGVKNSYPAIEYRLKTVPKPIPYFNNETGSVDMKKSKLLTGKFITAKLDDFLFELRYRVKSFEMFVSVGGKSAVYTAKGNKLTGEMKSVLRTMKPGQTAIFQKVVAQMDKAGSTARPLDGNIIIHVK
jgi:hypothetical protein